MTSLGGTPFGTRRMAGTAGAGAGTGVSPPTWNTPYDLFEERRTNSPLDVGGEGNGQVKPEDAFATSMHVNQQEAGSSAVPSSAAASAGAAALIAETVNVRGIKIAGWVIETHRGSIADSKSIDDLSDKLGIPLPEMPFDKNRLVIRYKGTSAQTSSGAGGADRTWEYVFDGQSALRSIEGVQASSFVRGLDLRQDQAGAQSSSTSTAPKTRAGGTFGQKPTKKSKRVQVSYANEWGKKREQKVPAQNVDASVTDGRGVCSSPSHETDTDMSTSAANGVISAPRDYDWTYSCTWPGGMSASVSSTFSPARDPAKDRIPVERLGPPSTAGAKAEPILFFDDVILYEDELGDNGTSMLSVKVRVMPTGFLVLQRFFLRVDNVVFRLFDTRMYVSFYEEAEGVDGAQHQHQQGTSASVRHSPFSPASRTGPPTTDLSRLSLGSPRQTQPPPSRSPKQATFASPMRVIRECCGYQERYSAVRARLPPYKPNDLAPLTDPGWVAQQITLMAEERARKGHRQDAVHPGTTVPLQQSDPSRPAVLPSAVVRGQESNRILGEIDDDRAGQELNIEEEQWEGEGHQIDVALVL